MIRPTSTRALLYMFTSASLFISTNRRHVLAIPVDNGLTGPPEINCALDEISVVFTTRKTFEGSVFVKGHYVDSECFTRGDAQTSIPLTLKLTSCGTKRSRSVDPPGIFISTTVIISFHPKFLTKVDRAYTIQCFYMEADKTVSSELEVSMLTTAFQTENVPMPVCRYEILDKIDGEPVRVAITGMPVYHQWTCDTETTDTFCMTVHSCYVTDEQDSKAADLLDFNGCAVDRYLLQNLEYLTDLKAGVESHVFKFPDRTLLYFTCQVTISIREPELGCRLPECIDLAVRRSRRAGEKNKELNRVNRHSGGQSDQYAAEVTNDQILFNMDISAKLDAVDIAVETEHGRSKHLPNSIDSQNSGEMYSSQGQNGPTLFYSLADQICISENLTASLISFGVAFLLFIAMSNIALKLWRIGAWRKNV